MTKKEIHVADLKNQIGTKGPRPFLYCRNCGSESSANAGDYFMTAPDYVFQCCDEPMDLVVKSTNYRSVF